MKYLKTIFSSTVISGIILVAGCEKDEPEIIPELPQIEFESLEFIEGSTSIDSLRLTISFSDGNFDLGLQSFDGDLSPPYNTVNFFTLQNGVLQALASGVRIVNGDPKLFIEPTSTQTGKLTTYRKIVNELDGTATYACSDYDATTPLWVNESDFEFIDLSYSILDTVVYSGTKAAVVQDTFLIEFNPNGFNITVDFIVEQPDGSYEEFDFRKEFCGLTSFDGRFPLLEGMQTGQEITSGPFKIMATSGRAGKMIYTMNSAGFQYFFSNKNLKLRVSIKDRSLNESNVVETPPILIPQ
jgi:hypothetical protein